MKTISGLFQKNVALTFLIGLTVLSLHVSAKNVINPKMMSNVMTEDSSVLQVAKESINVLNNDGTHGMVRIYTEKGKRLSETILMPGINSVDVSKLPHDTYFVCVTMDGGATYRQKFIKE